MLLLLLIIIVAICIAVCMRRRRKKKRNTTEPGKWTKYINQFLIHGPRSIIHPLPLVVGYSATNMNALKESTEAVYDVLTAANTEGQ